MLVETDQTCPTFGLKRKIPCKQYLWVSSLWLCSSCSPWRGSQTARRKSPRTVSPLRDTRGPTVRFIPTDTNWGGGGVSEDRSSYLILGVEAEWKADGVGGYGVSDHRGRRQSCGTETGWSEWISRWKLPFYSNSLTIFFVAARWENLEISKCT